MGRLRDRPRGDRPPWPPGVRLSRLGFAVLLMVSVIGGLTLDVVTAAPASAHATLTSTNPSEGARLPAAPRTVTLEFSEDVSADAGYVRVLSAEGERVDAGAATADGAVVTAPLRSDLTDASYVVTYRVVSLDAHPISGAYAFVVGDGDLVSASPAVAGGDTDPAVAAALPVARWIGFVGVALGLGVPVFLLVCWPAGWGVPLMRRMTSAGLTAIVVGGVLTFLLQGPYAAGSGLASIVDPSLIAATGSSSSGVGMLLRVLFAISLMVLLPLAWGGDGSPPISVVLVFGVHAVALVLTVAAVGHPAAGPLPGLAVSVAATHVAAMAVWLGGLAALLAGVLRSGAAAFEFSGALPRYSRLAFGAVVVLVLTGVAQSVREVGSPTVLLSTTYGRLLVAKLVLVLCLLAVAGVSRVWVQQHLGTARRRSPSRRVAAPALAPVGGGGGTDRVAGDEVAVPGTPAADDVRMLRRSVLVEAVIGALVLVVSAVLVGAPPARSAISQPVEATLPLQSDDGAAAGSVQVSVDPAGRGPNPRHVSLCDGDGRLAQPQESRVTLTEVAQQIGPLAVDLVPGGPGHVVGDGMSIPGPGTWTLSIMVRLDEFTATTASTDFRVR